MLRSSGGRGAAVGGTTAVDIARLCSAEAAVLVGMRFMARQLNLLLLRIPSYMSRQGLHNVRLKYWNECIGRVNGRRLLFFPGKGALKPTGGNDARTDNERQGRL
jgi:hypothetical protein